MEGDCTIRELLANSRRLGNSSHGLFDYFPYAWIPWVPWPSQGCVVGWVFRRDHRGNCIRLHHLSHNLCVPAVPPQNTQHPASPNPGILKSGKPMLHALVPRDASGRAPANTRHNREGRRHRRDGSFEEAHSSRMESGYPPLLSITSEKSLTHWSRMTAVHALGFLKDRQYEDGLWSAPRRSPRFEVESVTRRRRTDAAEQVQRGPDDTTG